MIWNYSQYDIHDRIMHRLAMFTRKRELRVYFESGYEIVIHFVNLWSLGEHISQGRAGHSI